MQNFCDFNKTANQKIVDQMDLGFAVKYDIQNLKKSGKTTDNQMRTFKQGSQHASQKAH